MDDNKWELKSKNGVVIVDREEILSQINNKLELSAEEKEAYSNTCCGNELDKEITIDNDLFNIIRDKINAKSEEELKDIIVKLCILTDLWKVI